MSVPEILTKIVGSWTGTNILFRPWTDQPETHSAATAIVAPVVNGHFTTIAYTWADDGTPHEGMFLIGRHPKDGSVTAAWIDSWHQSGSIMHCVGGLEGDGSIVVQGSYPAPPDPDWGWRTVISTRDGTSFTLEMTNIAPNGSETVAVRSRYDRRAGA